MIRSERSKLSIPSTLTNVRARKASEKITSFFKLSKKARAQKRPPFDHHVFANQEVKTAIKALFHEKCAYCETPLGVSSEMDINHFRPKGGAMNLDGTLDREHYCWLVYTWENIYPSCPICNRNKGSRFPAQGSRAKLFAKGEELATEQPLLIDPCNDEPHEHLSFNENGSQGAWSEE